MAKAAKKGTKKAIKKVDSSLHVNLTFEEALKKSITTKLPKKKK